MFWNIPSSSEGLLIGFNYNQNIVVWVSKIIPSRSDFIDVWISSKDDAHDSND